MGVIQYNDPTVSLQATTPLTYPPILPLIYAIPVHFLGFDLTAIKHIQLALLLMGLFLFCYAMRRWRFSSLEISVSVLVLTLSTELRLSTNAIEADLSSIFFVVLALLAIDFFNRKPGRYIMPSGILTGIAIFLAIDMRTAAVPLIPTLLLTDIIIQRRLRWLSLIVPVVTIGLLWICQSLVLHSGFSYGFVLKYPFSLL